MGKSSDVLVYIIKKDKDKYKIGRSVNPQRRIKQLQTGNEEALSLFCVFKSNDGIKLEGFLKNKCREIGKTFMVNNKKSEWFFLTQDQICVIIFELKTKDKHKFNIEIINETKTPP